VLIKRQLEHRGVELVVIVQPDSSLACIPAWMTHDAAARYVLCEKPLFPVDILQFMRTEVDALLGFLQSESKTEGADDDANFVVAEYWAHFAVWVSQQLLARATLIVRIPSRVRDFSNACTGENAGTRPAPRETWLESTTMA
jgi:hypothetical protein